MDAIAQVFTPDAVQEFQQGRACARGVGVEVAGCGLQDSQEATMRNRTPAAAAAAKAAEEERRRTADAMEKYMARQEALADRAAEDCEAAAPPAAPPALYHHKKWRDGIDGPAKESLQAYEQANPQGIQWSGEEGAPSVLIGKNGEPISLTDDALGAMDQAIREMLADAGAVRSGGDDEVEGEADDGNGGWQFSAAAGPEVKKLLRTIGALDGSGSEANAEPIRKLSAFAIWEGAEPSADQVQAAQKARELWEQRWGMKMQSQRQATKDAKKVYDGAGKPANVASAQIMAHFSQLCPGGTSKSFEGVPPPLRKHGDFGLHWLGEEIRPPPRRGVDLHGAVSDGSITIESVKGRGFGKNCLELKLLNNSRKDVSVAVRAGTVFQQSGWAHQQNLMVSFDHLVDLPPGGSATKLVSSFCMNLSCSCPSGNDMNLTDFWFDGPQLCSQGMIWDHFEGCFAREEEAPAGDGDGGEAAAEDPPAEQQEGEEAPAGDAE